MATYTYKDYTLAEYRLVQGQLTDSSVIVSLEDTASNLAGLTSQTISYFAADQLTKIRATDTNLSITPAQFDAIKPTGVTYDAATVVSIVADNTTLMGFTSQRLKEFKDNGVDALGSATPGTPWELTVAQYKAVIAQGLGFTQGDTITLRDTPANLQDLAKLSLTDIAALATNGVDTIATTGTKAPLTLSVAQAKALGAVKLGADFTTTISDKASLISGMSGTDFANALAAGVDAIAANDVPAATILISVDQATSLATDSAHITVTTAVTLADSGVNIARLTAAQIHRLAASGIKTVDVNSNATATSNKVSLTVAQVAAFVADGVKFSDGDIVTLSDTAANLGGLSKDTIAGLKTAGVSGITVKDGATLEWTADKAKVLDVTITSTGAVTLKDTGENIADLINAAQLGKLAGPAPGLGFTKINVDNPSDSTHGNDIALRVDQYKALFATALTFTAGDVVSIKDSGANLKGLPHRRRPDGAGQYQGRRQQCRHPLRHRHEHRQDQLRQAEGYRRCGRHQPHRRQH